VADGADGWDTPAGAQPAPDDVWTDPFEGELGEEDAWVDPVDDPALETPAARADWAFGRAVDPATPTAVLRDVASDLCAWDVDALLAEAAIMHGAEDVPDPTPGDRPDMQVLRSLLRHPNRPDDLAALLVGGWLEEPGARDPWPGLVGLAHDGELDDDLVVTALTEASDAARAPGPPPDWSLLVTAVGAARPGAGAALDLLAMVPFPVPDPTRLWPDAEKAAKGLPGGVRARAKVGAEALGWDGRRHAGLVDAVVAEVHRLDEQARRASFADSFELCEHGPVVITPSAVSLPSSTRGSRPYVARIVGSHPVFRLKRDWPDRDDGRDGTAWTWAGPEVLEARGLGCDRCRDEPDKGKRYFVSTGDEVALLRLRTLQRVLDALDDRAG
jgi:hypothetical protein